MKNYWLVGGGAILSLLLIASVIVAILQEEEDFEPGSPEAAAQDYIRALEEEDFEAAYLTLSPELRERCTIEDMFVGRNSSRWELEEKRITLESARTLNETTYVTVRVSELSGGGLFGPSEYSFEVGFALRQFDGNWKFYQNPWPSFDCTQGASESPKSAEQ